VSWGHVSEARAPLLEPKYLLDLRAANVYLLEKAGVKRENIIPAGPVCTHCEPRLLSFRRNPADPRRMFNFIGLRS
jgi:copper oxidase (laccase) domain-containing protein